MTIPCFESATIFGYWWLSQAIPQAVDRGFTVSALKMDDAVRAKFDKQVLLSDPELVHGVGHGNESVFTGQNLDILLESCVNDDSMAGRIVYLLSCMTARRLGATMVSKGAKAYMGYYEDFIWGDLEFPPGGYYHGIFMDLSNLIVGGLLCGDSVSTVYSRCMARYNAWVDYLSTLEDDPYIGSIIQYLINDFENLAVYGDVNAKATSKLNFHVGSIFLVGYQDLITYGSDLKVRVAVNCQSDNCSFGGRKVKVYDNNGNLIATLPITHIGNGINIAEGTIPFSKIQNIVGSTALTLILDPDEVHPAIIGHVRIWIAQPIDVVGYAYEVTPDAHYKAAGATVEVMGVAGAIANSEGWFEISGVPIGTYWHGIYYKNLI